MCTLSIFSIWVCQVHFSHHPWNNDPSHCFNSVFSKCSSWPGTQAALNLVRRHARHPWKLLGEVKIREDGEALCECENIAVALGHRDLLTHLISVNLNKTHLSQRIKVRRSGMHHLPHLAVGYPGCRLILRSVSPWLARGTDVFIPVLAEQLCRCHKSIVHRGRSSHLHWAWKKLKVMALGNHFLPEVALLWNAFKSGCRSLQARGTED